MHYHAIRLSAGFRRDMNTNPKTGPLHLDGNNSGFNRSQDHGDQKPAYPMGDDACDSRPVLTGVNAPISDLPDVLGPASSSGKAIASPRRSETLHEYQMNRGVELARDSHSGSVTSSASRLTEENARSLNSSFSHWADHELIPRSSNATIADGWTTSTRTGSQFLQVSIPSCPTNNLAPFAYQRVMRNRIRDDELGPGRKYDTKAYTPMFVHDCLMMPGSLASIRGKGSAEDLVHRMTPALLPGFHTHIHATTSAPILLQSPTPGSHAHGMLVLGQPRDVRDNVHGHYRATHKRVKIEIELDTVHPVPRQLRNHPTQRWELRRRSVWAHAWLWRSVLSGDVRVGGETWSLDDLLAGKYQDKRGLRIEPAGWIEDEREGTVGSGDSAASASEWKVVQEGEEEHFGEWEAGSGDGGGAVPFDDDIWDRVPWTQGDQAGSEEGQDRPRSTGVW